jgi:hypothetical protein
MNTEQYHKHCEDFHKERLDTADSAWKKLYRYGKDEDFTVTLTEYERLLAAEALMYYMRKTK